MNLDEPLRFKLHQGLSNRDAAHPELARQRVLAERKSGLEIAVENPMAQAVCHGSGYRPMLKRLLRWSGGRLGFERHRSVISTKWGVCLSSEPSGTA